MAVVEMVALAVLLLCRQHKAVMAERALQHRVITVAAEAAVLQPLERMVRLLQGVTEGPGQHRLLLALLLPVRAVAALVFLGMAPLAQVGRAVAAVVVKPQCYQLRAW